MKPMESVMKPLSDVALPYSAVRRELAFAVGYAPFLAAFESLLGRTDPAALHDLPSLTPEKARARLAAFVGPSDFSLFQKIDHGGLMSALTERRTQAMTYVFGNALIAIEMTRHAPVVGLYVPLRLYVRETEPGRILVTYDLPSATMAQLKLPAVDTVAQSLDDKVEKLVFDAVTHAAGER